MTRDPELDAWEQQWHTRTSVPAGLRGLVERDIRAQRRGMIGSIVITFVFGAATLAWAVVSGQRDAVVLAAGTWALIGIAWLTSIVLGSHRSRGIPEAETTTTFLDFAIRESERKRASIAAAAALYPVVLAFGLVWRFQIGPASSLTEYLVTGRMVLIAAVTVALGFVGARKYRAFGLQLKALRSMRERLGDQDESQ